MSRVRWWVPLVGLVAAWFLAAIGPRAVMPEPVPLDPDPIVVAKLIVLPGARRALAALNNDSLERFACLYGRRLDELVLIRRAEPGRMRRESRAGGWYVTEVTCPADALGLAHNHPRAERCWFRFPGTYVNTSDRRAFQASGLPLSVIVCGARLVGIVR